MEQRTVMTFPMFVTLEGRTCLVVGAGNVAQRKRAALESFGATVVVVAPETCGRGFVAGDVEGMALVVAATNDTTVNRRVAEICRARNIPVNVVDDPANCTFFFPAIFRKGPVTVAVSSGGTCPVAARLVRDRVAQVVPDDFIAAVEGFGRRREELKRQYPDPKERARICEKELSNGVIREWFAK